MNPILKIGTRESELAVWQATQVQLLLKENNFSSELVYIKSEGDIDTVTPLYELGVQGIFTKTLDSALLNKKIDIAVHSMKDVPTQLAKGIQQAAVLKRGSYKDILVLHPDLTDTNGKLLRDSTVWTSGGSRRDTVNHLVIPLREKHSEEKWEQVIIGTSSIRRIAQWLNRNKEDKIENLRGNVNTRLRKLKESNWHGAIFAAAGLERINLRPENAIDLDWMLPAPAQGAIMIVCREDDSTSFKICQNFNDADTALCTKLERDFLRALLGGCSTPISALAKRRGRTMFFKGNICSPDGKEKIEVEKKSPIENSEQLGIHAAEEILKNPFAQNIIHSIRNEKK
ncbi:MAG TPA: hydroxymethylbilane synthase [Chitinophagaceae bacterium]|nr:hydroxymethylbilane synthase [Chitinophagaceae bacterium]